MPNIFSSIWDVISGNKKRRQQEKEAEEERINHLEVTRLRREYYAIQERERIERRRGYVFNPRMNAPIVPPIGHWFDAETIYRYEGAIPQLHLITEEYNGPIDFNPFNVTYEHNRVKKEIENMKQVDRNMDELKDFIKDVKNIIPRLELVSGSLEKSRDVVKKQEAADVEIRDVPDADGGYRIAAVTMPPTGNNTFRLQRRYRDYNMKIDFRVNTTSPFTVKYILDSHPVTTRIESIELKDLRKMMPEIVDQILLADRELTKGYR